ncbi:Uncharacterised protein g6180 [Pycnogonum litorale]
MGEIDFVCDNATDENGVDWNGSPVNYTCYSPLLPIPVNDMIKPLHINESPPENYLPWHICMYDKIVYNRTIPTFGNHRPNWPKYGEYKFVPPQRWLHNVEHGGVILMYHPCVMMSELEKAKTVVVNCIWKHIITANNLLSSLRPITLVTWGHRLEMNKVNEDLMKDFIKKYAHHGPEGQIFKDGLYTRALLEKSQYPYQLKSIKVILCPDVNR